MKRYCSILLCFALIWVYAIPAALADHTDRDTAGFGSFHDIEGHWARSSIKKWAMEGVVHGDGKGAFKPNDKLSRGELAAILNSLFGFTLKADHSFSDVPADKWYTDEAAIAVAADYMSGYPDGTFRPEEPITRQEMAVVLANLFELEGKVQSLGAFADTSQIAGNARPAMAGLIEGGYMSGYPDQTLRPAQAVTRAEIASVLDRLVGQLNSAGNASEGNILVNRDKVVLEQARIGGNLYLAAGIGQGQSTVRQAEVDGTVYVQGGGADSIYFAKSTLQRIIIKNKQGVVRVVLSDGSVVKHMEVRTKAIIDIGEKDEVGQLRISRAAAGTVIQIQGSIGELMIEADDVMLNGKMMKAGDVVSVQRGKVTSLKSGAPNVGSNTGTIESGNPDGGSPGGGTPGGGNPPHIPEPEPVEEWTLIWQDEFNGDEIDRTKWTFDLGDGTDAGTPGWGNNELQYYTDRPDNVRVEGGQLIITAKKEDFAGYPYTSARIKTKGLESWTYGKFEARVQLPTGKGLWPAVWMMPESSEYGGWAASGELDIMESWGSKPNEIAGTIHYGENWPKNVYAGKTTQLSKPVTEWHTYGIEWEPGEIRWYVDGRLYHTLNNWYSKGQNQPLNYAYPAPFDKPFHLIMNLAVGGNFDGNPAESTVFPAEMKVDYVRVYELTGRPYRTPVQPELEADPIPEDARPPLADGNLVYNNNFDQDRPEIEGIEGVPNTDYWRFLHVPDFGGSGSVAIDPIDGRNYAKVEITSGGNQNYSIQLIQHVPLVKGRWYELSFDARTEGSRSMVVKVGADADRGYEGYASSDPYALRSDLNTYKLTFQMNADTNLNARLEFNLGLSQLPVWIGDVRLVEVDAPKADINAAHKPAADGNHVYNGTFDQGDMDRLTYWQFGGSQIHDTRYRVDEQARELEVAMKGAGNLDDVYVYQNGIQLIQDQDYRLIFDARANQTKPVKVELRSQDGAISYYSENITLGTVMASYEMKFKMNQPTNDLSQLIFYISGQPGQLYLDNIRLERTSMHIDPDVVLFPLKNGKFHGGLDPWIPYVHAEGGAQAHMTAENGEFKAAIGQPGSDEWHVLLEQSGMSLSQDIPYIVSFDARSTIPRDMGVIFENAAYQRYLDQKVALTPEMTRHSIEFTMRSNDVGSLKFLMGKMTGATADHEIYIDNVVFEVKGARAIASIVKNGDFSSDLTEWESYTDPAASAKDAAVIGGQFTQTIMNEGTEFWHVHLKQSDLMLQAGKTYVLTFEAASSIGRKIQIKVEKPDNSPVGDRAEQWIELSPERSAYEIEFTANDTAPAALVFGFGGGIPGQEPIGGEHTITLGPISLIEWEDYIPEPVPEPGPLRNGSFDENTDHWQLYTGDGSNAQISVVHGELEVTFPNYDGWFPWSTQIFQEHLLIEPGKTYRLKFDIRSTLAKPAIIKMERSNSVVVMEERIQLTESMEPHDITFVAGGDNNRAKLYFFFGSENVPGENFVPHAVYLDNIELEEVKLP